MEQEDFYNALIAVQAELRAGKDQYNQYGGYKYRSAESILAAVKPILSKHSLIINLTDELLMVGDRYYIKARATIYRGQELQFSEAFAREPLQKKGMDESQVTGSASSYARKYALCGLLGIDDASADPDNPANHPDNPATQKRDARIKAAAERGAAQAKADKAKAAQAQATDAAPTAPAQPAAQAAGQGTQADEEHIKADVAACADFAALAEYYKAHRTTIGKHIGYLSARKKELLEALKKSVAKCATIEALEELKAKTTGLDSADVREVFDAREDEIKSADELAAVL